MAHNDTSCSKLFNLIDKEILKYLKDSMRLIDLYGIVLVLRHKVVKILIKGIQPEWENENITIDIISICLTFIQYILNTVIIFLEVSGDFIHHVYIIYIYILHLIFHLTLFILRLIEVYFILFPIVHYFFV